MLTKKVKICHLTSVHPPFDIRIFYKECISLANNGFEVTLVAPIEKSIKKNGIEIVPIRVPNFRLWRFLFISFKMYWIALKQKAKLYHFHDPELILCGILLKLSRKKVIYDIHENVRLTILDKPYLNKILKRLLYWSYIFFEKIALLFYDQKVLALSEETFSKYYKKSRSTIILNFPLKLLKKSKTKEVFKSPVRFIYTGAVFEHRGIFEMIKLAEYLNKKNIDFIFDVVGKIWPDDLSKEIKSLLIQLGLDNKFILHGYVDAKMVSSYIQNAHIGVSLLHPFVRYQEALPTKIFEYMQHGLPVVTNNFSLLKDYVEKTETGLCIDIKNINFEVDKIIKLLKDQKKMKKMGRIGIKLTDESWNWESQEIKLIQLYKNLLNL